MNLTGFTTSNHVYVPERLKPDTVFEKKYINLRWQEKRIYSDEEVLYLPGISNEHPHYREWKGRKRSCKKLVGYLGKKQTALKILEVGCGNGWLSRQLSAIAGAEVIGADVNFTELQQAARVFNEVPNLQFIYGDIRSEILGSIRFDIIVFAASIQYFPCLSEIVNTAFQLIKTGGEIHILDSHFYSREESLAAKKRTFCYYEQLGVPEMSNHYFHHCLDELKGFQVEILNKRVPFSSLFNRNNNPFTWFCIKKNLD